MNTFRDSLNRHLDAIHRRDLEALASTVASDGLTLIMADGRLVRSRTEYLSLHQAWFAQHDWRLTATPVHLVETAAAAYAVLHLLYEVGAAETPCERQESWLTLGFERRNGAWVMVHDQNTPIRTPGGAA
jgi:uncharacterized protein (TIGR02246 family)